MKQKILQRACTILLGGALVLSSVPVSAETISENDINTETEVLTEVADDAAEAPETEQEESAPEDLNADTAEKIDKLYYTIEERTEADGSKTKYAVVTDTSINKNDFTETGDQEIVIPSTISVSGEVIPVTEIGADAFYLCKKLTKITIPQGVTSIGDCAFLYCTKLTEITLPDGLKSIGASAFKGCKNITNISLPQSLTGIGSAAFAECGGLTAVVLPQGITSVPFGGFSKCSGLISVTIPEGVTEIENTAFSECTSLTGITIPGSVTKIATSAFEKCVALKEINLGSGITSIGDRAFAECKALTSITIPAQVTNIARGAFSGCSALTAISLPSTIGSVPEAMFSYCSALTTVTIPDGITAIGDSAFTYCSSLTTVTIPASVTKIGSSAFWSTKLKTVNYGGSPEQWKAIAKESTSFGNLRYTIRYGKEDAPKPEEKEEPIVAPVGTSLSEAGGRAYKVTSMGGQNAKPEVMLTKLSKKDKKAKKITMPKTIVVYGVEYKVTKIAPNIFKNCKKLQSITISNNITEIGAGAFKNCKNLKKITIKSPVLKKVGKGAFSGIHKKCVIKVPKKQLKAYKALLKGKGQKKSVKIKK